MASYYASVDQVRWDAKPNDDSDVTDAQVLQQIRWASARIDAWLKRKRDYLPEPYLETRYFDVPEFWQQGSDEYLYSTLQFDNFLLETPTSVTLPDVTTLSSQNYNLLRESSAEPYTALTLKEDATSWYETLGGDDARPEKSIAVTGLWGYRHRYSSAWSTATTLSSGVNASTTTLPITSDHVFEVGNLIKVNSEFMRVSTVHGNNSLTVIRGENGTSSDAHLSGASVSIYQIDDTINRACVRASGFMLARRSAFNIATFDGVTTESMPRDLPDEVLNILDEMPRFIWAVR